jgi:hypothetical protein
MCSLPCARVTFQAAILLHSRLKKSSFEPPPRHQVPKSQVPQSQLPDGPNLPEENRSTRTLTLYPKRLNLGTVIFRAPIVGTTEYFGYFKARRLRHQVPRLWLAGTQTRPQGINLETACS